MTRPRFSKPLLLPLALSVAASMVGVHTACSSTGGTTYQRGTLARPPPAQQRPGVGAPTYDPHAPRAKPEPGPVPERILPQTPETMKGPGLWNAKEPVAGPIAAPSIIGVTMPLPDECSDLEFGEARACAAVVGIAANEAGTTYALSRLPSKVKKCAAAMLFQNCIDTMKLQSEKDVKANVHGAAVMLNARRRVAATARAFAEKVCPPEATPTEAVNLVATTNSEVFEVVKR